MMMWYFPCTVKFMSVDDQIAILGSGNHGRRPNFFSPFSLPFLSLFPLHVVSVSKEEVFIK
jgi:hypothetical protein